MKPFSFILFDIKRLFGHGKTAIIAILSPIPVLLLFATFLIPFLTTDSGAKLSIALYNADTDEGFDELVNMIIAPEVSSGRAVIYPVKDIETGKKLVEEGKVAAFLYIPPNTYTDPMNGKRAVIEYYYSKEHAFDSLMFYASAQSSLSVFGQGIRIVYLSTDIALEKGITEEEVITLWEKGSSNLIDVLLHRGSIIGIDGVFSPGNDYQLRFLLAGLFAVCAYFVSFPVLYLTSLDISNIIGKRNIPKSNLAGYYFARLFSGTLLIMCSFMIMYPLARIIRRFPVRLAFSVFPAMILTSLAFSALAILIGALFKKGHTSLWVGLYFGFVSILGVVFLISGNTLPKPVSFLMEISPLRASLSIFSNALFEMVPERYFMDMFVLLASFIVFTICGFVVYMKRGSKV
ncbi:MAG: ABC transporter permease [Lachnospiraceae bacterium]|nr:ABC transporter permease [Lachnospiraceae bacterium]